MDSASEAILGHAGALSAALLAWYRREGRDLPWRARPSLYRTVVSEFMLQQTQVATALPFFRRWMERFPDFEALAAASAEDVLKHWEGLGYYARARNLHRLAQTWRTLEQVPETAEEWRRLPGVGPYTAAAIASIAMGRAEAAVDGNVVRVLARLTGERRVFRGSGEAVEHFRPLARALVDPGAPGDHNQAMMELGARVCLKRRPLCTVCPVLPFCRAAREGEPGDLPRIERPGTERETVDRLWIEADGRLALRRIPDEARRLAGQRELPSRELFRGPLPRSEPIARRARGIGNRRITERIARVRASAALRRQVEAHPELEWVAWSELEGVTVSGPHRRWIRELRGG